MFLKADLCSGNQLIGLFFSAFLSNGRKAAAFCAKFGRYLVRCCIDPMKLLSCLNVLGGDNFSIATVFFMSGLVPSLFMV